MKLARAEAEIWMNAVKSDMPTDPLTPLQQLTHLCCPLMQVHIHNYKKTALFQREKNQYNGFHHYTNVCICTYIHTS